MQKIRKICDSNEYWQKEWIQILNDFNSSIKKMIKHEQGAVSKLL